jgi:quercetin dioxygenase-like cupin family protein
MEARPVLFDSLDWQSPAPGLRIKVYRSANKQMRLLEHAQEFVEPDWCVKAHTGLVLKGELEIDFNGRIVSFPEGSGLFIPAGEKHKARPVTTSVLLFLVEDI